MISVFVDRFQFQLGPLGRGQNKAALKIEKVISFAESDEETIMPHQNEEKSSLGLNFNPLNPNESVSDNNGPISDGNVRDQLFYISILRDIFQHCADRIFFRSV